MKQDFKDSTFSFKDKKRKKNKKRLRFLIISSVFIIFAIIASVFLAAGKCRRVEKLILNNKINQAVSILSSINNPVLRRRTKILNAIAALCQNEKQRGKEILSKINSPGRVISHKKIIDVFFSNADYDKAEIYLNFLKKGNDQFDIFESTLLTAKFNPALSEEKLKTVKKTNLKNLDQKKINILHLLNNKLKKQKIEYIFDRNQLPLAAFDLETERTISFTPGFFFNEFTEKIKTKGIHLYTLSLDLAIQKKLDLIFQNHFGSFILMDLSDSSIRAAYSKPHNNTKVNSVFSKLQEPGSIVKILTLYAYLLNPKDDLFPFYCEKPLTFNNQAFYDWTAHGKVDSFIDALSQSCNHSFAKMALAAGKDSLESIFTKFFFNHEPITDEFLKFDLGSYQSDVSELEFVRQAVGLPPLKSTTFHSAFFTAIITMNGSVNTPFLIKNIKNIFNIPFYNHKNNLLTIFKNTNLQFLKIKEAMTAVVNNPEGTGRRSKVSFVQTAVKTGTTGSSKEGLNAVLVGLFPADHPEYVFALNLSRSGRAEFKAAHFLKEFLKAFYNK